MFPFVRSCRCHSRPVIFLQRSISLIRSASNELLPAYIRKEKFIPKARNKLKARQPNLSRKLRLEFEKHRNETPVISCRHIEFNFFEGMKYGKFEPVPLVSKSWGSRKSNGDYFTIHMNQNVSTEDVHFGNIFTGKSTEPRLIVDPNKENKEEQNFTHFAELGIEKEIYGGLEKLGIERAADIQVAAIPVLLKGANSLISAHTGCGKTLAYLLPLIQMTLKRNQREIQRGKSPNTPSVVIITPSRELAEQIHDVLLKVADKLPISARLFIGGHLRSKLTIPKVAPVDILVGSLGALNKAFGAGIFQLDCVSHIVLDEADQLLDEDNVPRVTNILKKIKVQYGPPVGFINEETGAQVILVSATVPLSLHKCFENILAVDHLEKVTTRHLHHVLKCVPQTFLKVGKTNKGKVLVDIVEPDFKKGKSILIFSNKVVTAYWVSLHLNGLGISCSDLTRKTPSWDRKNLMNEFKNGNVQILSTTPMAARGIDTCIANHVINFEFPLYMSEYIHQVGRVGRIGSPDLSHVTNLISHAREVLLVQKIEMAIRTGSELKNVNANIPGILSHRNRHKVE